jgi:catechol 2,3-dioxygenase-like lactoylglutathione lyase family enzyme
MSRIQQLQHVSVPMPPDGHAVARRFYGHVLDMEEVPVPSPLAARAPVWFRAGGDGHEVHVFVEEQWSADSARHHFCLQVDDLADYRERLTEEGVEVVDTVEIAGRARFHLRDPFGNRIELTQITGDYR